MRKALSLKNYGDGRTPIADPPEQPKFPGKKDTKRWCKGKAGQEHDIEIKRFSELVVPPTNPQNIERLKTFKTRLKITVCRRCGKHLGMMNNAD